MNRSASTRRKSNAPVTGFAELVDGDRVDLGGARVLFQLTVGAARDRHGVAACRESSRGRKRRARRTRPLFVPEVEQDAHC